MKILLSNLWPGGLCTDNANNDTHNNTRRTIHDSLGSLAFMTNEATITKHDEQFMIVQASLTLIPYAPKFWVSETSNNVLTVCSRNCSSYNLNVES